MYGIDLNCFEVNEKNYLKFTRLDQALVVQGQNQRKQDNVFERIKLSASIKSTTKDTS